MDVQAIEEMLRAEGLAVFDGYAATGTLPPYVVHRPLVVDYVNLAIAGNAIDWDAQEAFYCVGGSVRAAHNLALLVVDKLHGARVGDTTLAASVGYSGAQVEGLYESQVTVQINQGVLT